MNFSVTEVVIFVFNSSFLSMNRKGSLQLGGND
jgi:hypothetical protein